MSKLRRRRFVYFVCALLTAAAFWLFRSHDPATDDNATRVRQLSPAAASPGTPPSRPGQSAVVAPGPAVVAGPAGPTAPAADPALHAALGAFLTELKNGLLSRPEALARLKALKSTIHALPPDVAAATLIAWLDSAADAPTGLAFQVGPEGVMAEAPTFRTCLLDWLGQTDPSASLAYSQDLLGANPLPEEYALALRNIAWINPDGAQNIPLRQGFLRLLTTPNLAANPTPGYLESFDIAVAVADANLVRDLLAYQSSRTENAALSRATFITLDRIMLRNPAVILDAFALDPSLLADQPNWRASLLARLDPTDPRQVAQLKNYLLNTPHAETELGYFASIYPLASYFEGNRLVTDWETVHQSQTIPERDASASKLIQSLLADTAFKNVTGTLENILHRIMPPVPPPSLGTLTPAM